jgi:hypothetical protein
MKASAALLIIVVLFLVLFPFGIIWAGNTLFGLGIPYTLKTWVASLIVWTLFGSSAAGSSSK